MKRLGIVLLTSLILSGCASNLPVEITTELGGSPNLAEARQAPDSHQGQTVRWGGTIARVENQSNQTTLEIVSRNLSRQGRPEQDDTTDGRFIAVVEGFLDPVIYSAGREVTVNGQLAGVVDGKIDQHDYQYPVVTAKVIHLWEEIIEVQPMYPPGYWPYHDPFWDSYWRRQFLWGPGWY